MNPGYSGINRICFLRLDCPNWKGIYRDSDDLSLYWLRRHHFVEVHEFIPKID